MPTISAAHVSRIAPSSAKPPVASPLTKLSGLLSGKLEFTATAKAHIANEMTTKRRTLPLDHTQAFAAVKADGIKKFESIIGPKTEWTTDVKQKYVANMGAKAAHDFLVALAPNKKAQLEALLKDPSMKDAKFGYVQIYDASSEVIGRESLVVTPKNGKSSLVIDLDYVQA